MLKILEEHAVEQDLQVTNDDLDLLLKKLESVGMYPPGIIQLDCYPGYSDNIVEPTWEDEDEKI